MNPFHLDATGLMVWGLVAHLIADWPLQNDWMANNKMKRRQRFNPTTMTGESGTPYFGAWWDRHLAAYVHASIHGILLTLVFGWVAIPLALAHLIIDTRTPVVWWSMLIKQTQPTGSKTPFVDIGIEVRFWTDQVFHIVCVAVASLVIG